MCTTASIASDAGNERCYTTGVMNEPSTKHQSIKATFPDFSVFDESNRELKKHIVVKAKMRVLKTLIHSHKKMYAQFQSETLVDFRSPLALV